MRKPSRIILFHIIVMQQKPHLSACVNGGKSTSHNLFEHLNGDNNLQQGRFGLVFGRRARRNVTCNPNLMFIGCALSTPLLAACWL